MSEVVIDLMTHRPHLRHDIKPVAWYNRGTQPVSKLPSGPYYFCAPCAALSAQA